MQIPRAGKRTCWKGNVGVAVRTGAEQVAPGVIQMRATLAVTLSLLALIAISYALIGGSGATDGDHPLL